MMDNETPKKNKFYCAPENYYDSIAGSYDIQKKKNLYYFQNLVSLYKSLIVPSSNIIEIGSGTGDLIAHLEVKEGAGFDISEKMTEIAQKKYAGKKNIKYKRHNIFDSQELFRADYIILADVLEHIENLKDFLNQLSARTQGNSKIIISVINPIWEWAMILAEKLNMKIPEGPSERISVSKTEILFKKAGFNIQERGYRFLIPKRIPFSDLINKIFHKNKFFAKYGFTVYWVLSKQNEKDFLINKE